MAPLGAVSHRFNFLITLFMLILIIHPLLLSLSNSVMDIRKYSVVKYLVGIGMENVFLSECSRKPRLPS